VDDVALKERLAALEQRVAGMKPNTNRAPLSLRDVARRLRVSFPHTLQPAVRRGEIRTVPYGKRSRVPYDEFLRLESEGVSEQKKRRKVTPVRVAAIPVDIDADVARLKHTSLKDSLAAARARRAAG
jgi:hypothetical protein